MTGLLGRRGGRGLAFLAVVVALVVVTTVAERTRRQFDLTASNSLTLSDETHEVLDRVDERIEVIGLLGPEDAGRAEALALMSRYTRLNRRVTFRVIDPREQVGEILQLGGDPTPGALFVKSGDKVERAPAITEQDITAGIARIVRGRSALVCIALGHGEPDPNSILEEGMTAARDLLRQNGYRVDTVDLLSDPRVPPGCEGLLLVNPLAPLDEAASKAVADYLAAEGRALLFADPASTVDLTPFLQPYGLRIERGIVFEGDADSRVPDDLLSPIIRDYRATHPVVRRLAPVVFPATQALVESQEKIDGLVTAGVARTSETSYLERKPAEPAFDENEDLKGPITVVAVADLSGVFEGKVRRTRLAAFADADFVTNAFIGQAGNARMFIQAVDWVLLDEDLVSVSPNLPSVRPLPLTEGRTRYAMFLSAGVVPGLFLVFGGLVWAWRRSR